MVGVLMLCTSLSAQQGRGNGGLAAIFPGSIQDADYNALGHVTVQTMGKKFNIKTAFSERVAVPDAERKIREYIDEGFRIVWVHGNQFNDTAELLADAFPDTSFILEGDGAPDKPKANIWYIDRNYYTGFYVLGRLAALSTRSGKIAWIGGLDLPFTRGEINALRQAFKDGGRKVQFEFVYTGDFNDAVKARRLAEGLIARDFDVLLSALNLGNFGLYTAVKEAGRRVYFTSTYTSKKNHAPLNYLSADIFDFDIVLAQVLERIGAGEKGGSLLMEYGPGKARYTDLPLSNVGPGINSALMRISDDVAAGRLKMVRNLSQLAD